MNVYICFCVYVCKNEAIRFQHKLLKFIVGGDVFVKVEQNFKTELKLSRRVFETGELGPWLYAQMLPLHPDNI